MQSSESTKFSSESTKYNSESTNFSSESTNDFFKKNENKNKIKREDDKI